MSINIPKPADDAPIFPDLEEAMAELVKTYGSNEVRAAVYRNTKQKRGPKKKDDWGLLRDTVKADAEALLTGEATLEARSNRSMGRIVAEKVSPINPSSVIDRVRRKASKERKMRTLAAALELARTTVPFTAYIALLDDATRVLPDASVALGLLRAVALETHESYLDRFERDNPSLSLAELEKANLDPPQRGIGVGLIWEERRKLRNRQAGHKK